MTDAEEPRFEAAAGLRALAHALSAHDADEETLAAIREFCEARAAELTAGPRRERIVPRFGELVVVEPDARRRHPMDDRAIAGPANPTSVEMTETRDGDDAVAQVTFGAAFEGAPGRVHGGMVAAVFDDLTGRVLAMVGEPGFTGRLTVEYRAPVPTEREVEFRVRLRERDGRKLYAEGEARLEERVLAICDATMILVDPDHWSKHAKELLGE